MRSPAATGLAAGLLLAASVSAVPAAGEAKRDVDTSVPYTGPEVPVGDWVDPTLNGNGKGFPRLHEPPAVKPATANPTNNVNVIALSYLQGGMNIHYQTPFALGEAPTVKWGTSKDSLDKTATGSSKTYDRTPPCSAIRAVTQCSQFFHDVGIKGLASSTTYYYKILAANGTTESDVLSFETAQAAGDKAPFTVAVVNDMGYTNAQGTHKYLLSALTDGAAFTWHGGDLSYADDWYSGILPCADDWPVCYNGTSTELPGPAPIPAEYDVPLPAGEIANQGGPNGGDMSTIYESNWDLWQQWMNDITTLKPYQVLPGNHEPSCGEFDGPNNELTALLVNDDANGTAAESTLNYYSCPPSQRNFTAFQNRFQMSGEESGGVSNFWYSFDYGSVHFVSLDGETDFASSPEVPFISDNEGKPGVPAPEDTFITDSGPFGAIENGDYKNNAAYEQVQWLEKDLASVDRCATPWIIVMAHRPMYSSAYSGYQLIARDAFEPILLAHGVDVYMAGHIHWLERIKPMGRNGTIDTDSIIDDHTNRANPGKSITHLTNGAAGNVESHSTLDGGKVQDLTQFVDFTHFGLSTLDFNETALTWKFIQGDTGNIGDYVTVLKKADDTCSSGSSTSSICSESATATESATAASSPSVYVTTTTEVVNSYTTYCPYSTTLTHGSQTYTVTAPTTLTITECPCTLTHTVTSTYPTSSAVYVSPTSSSVYVVPPPAANTTAPVVSPPPVPGAGSKPAVAGLALLAAGAALLL